VSPRDQLVEALDREGIRGVREGLGHAVHPEVQAGHHTEESRAGPACCPVEVAVGVGIRVHQLSIGGDDIDG